MTTQPFELDPDVEHILQEVAKDPRSSLLRVERPKIIRGLTEREASVGVATAGLTSAERHLVQTRRAETAFALRALCLQAILADPRSGHLISRQGAASDRSLKTTIAEVRRSWETDETMHPRSIEEDASFIRQAMQSSVGNHTDVLRLASIAHRLDPSDYGRLNSAVWLLLESQPAGAISILRNILSIPSTKIMNAVACTNLGLACYDLGRITDSLAWYRMASRQQSDYTSGLVSYLLVALQEGLFVEAVEAARLIDDRNELDSVQMQWQRAAASARRTQFQARLTHAGQMMIDELRDAVGPISRSLIHAVQ